jgi:hypothetical protein
MLDGDSRLLDYEDDRNKHSVHGGEVLHQHISKCD